MVKDMRKLIICLALMLVLVGCKKVEVKDYAKAFDDYVISKFDEEMKKDIERNSWIYGNNELGDTEPGNIYYEYQIICVDKTFTYDSGRYGYLYNIAYLWINIHSKEQCIFHQHYFYSEYDFDKFMEDNYSELRTNSGDKQ